MEEHEVNRLLNRLIDGSISQEDFARIQGVMRVSPEVREEYYDLIGLDQMLSESYEVPTHISVQAKAMDDHWVVSRSKHKVIKVAVWAAAACVMLSLGSFYLFRDKGPAGTMKPSSDCRFAVNGTEIDVATMKQGEVLALKKDEWLEVKQGFLSLKIGPNVDVCVEGPAQLSLTDQEGELNLKDGSVFLDIMPGGKGFEVHTPAGILRDIGTKFGVHVAGDSVETHVTDGTVRIDRGNGGSEGEVRAGEMAAWTGKAGSIRRGLSISGGRHFVEVLPGDETIFDDDFGDPDGTVLDKKMPDIGLAWATLMEINPSTIVKGVLDTSKGPRSLLARFKDGVSTDKRKLYVVNFSTRVPGNIWDKAGYPDAAERITFLRSRNGGPLFSLVARKSRDHHWQIKNEEDGVHSIGSRISALQPYDLTLTYDSATGEVRLYEGTSTRGTLIDTPFKVGAGHSLDSILISNDEGGDVALENLKVRMLTYREIGGAAGNR
jgi:hypothetical protein